MLLALYARVSTQRQENEGTIDSQIEDIKLKAEAAGHIIVQEYLDDGWSGDMLARPALDRLRDDADKNIWEGVMAYDQDRIARRYSYQEFVIDELEEKGLKVLFCTSSRPQNGEEKILQGVKGLFAEYERLKIAERMRRGKLHKARSGHVVGTMAPYGYNYIPKQGDKNGYYKVNPSEAETVKMIFEWVAYEGKTIKGVARGLMELGIKPRRSKRGVWNSSTITRMLQNETYIGKSYFNKSESVVPKNPIKDTKYKKIKKTSRVMRPEEEWIEIPVPRIISDDLFKKTRARLAQNYKYRSRNKKYNYLLNSMIYCTCGKPRTGDAVQKGKHLYYRCCDRIYSHPLPATCNEKNISAEIVDKLVWQRVSQFMSNSDLIRGYAEKWLESKYDKTNDTQDSVDVLKHALDKIKKEEDRYVKAFGAGVINETQLKERTEEISENRTALQKQIRDKVQKIKDNTVNVPEPQQIDAFCKQAQKVLTTLSFKTKQEILRNVLDKVVANQQELQVYGYLPVREESYVEVHSINRNSRPTERRQINTI